MATAVAQRSCEKHGEFKGSKGWNYHRRWCKVAKTSGGRSAKPTTQAQSPEVTTPREKAPVGNWTYPKGKRLKGKDGVVYSAKPSKTWLQVYADEVSGGHRKAVARANKATDLKVGFDIRAGELPPRSGESEPTAHRTKGRSPKVTSGTIVAESLPKAELLDKNGRPLTGAALARRVAKLQRAGEAQQAEAAKLPTSDHPLSERVDALESVVLTLGESVAKLTDKVGDLLDQVAAKLLIEA